MSTQVIEKEDVANVEDILGDVIREVEAEESAISPADEVEKVAENGPDFSPLENEKVVAKCLSFHNAVLKLKDASFYRNAGKASYINYIVNTKKSITGMHFSKKSARISMHHTDGKKSTGDTSIGISESGYSTDGESLTLKEILSQVKKYRRDRGWD